MSKKKEEQLAQAQKTAEAARQAAAPQSGYSTADLNSRSDVQNALAGAEYRPSQNVTDAANDLKQWQQNRPGQYQSAYQDKMDELMDALLGRDSFQYSYAQDPLYRQYAQLYTQNAANASADAAAQAAALTGGYGSSYAASVAQQAYQQQIGALSEAIPTLYRLALDTYTGGGEELVTKLDQLGVREQNDQNLYNNELADYYTQLQQKGDAYNAAYAQDYGQYQDYLNRLDTLYGYYAAQEQQAASRKQEKFNRTMKVLGFLGDTKEESRKMIATPLRPQEVSRILGRVDELSEMEEENEVPFFVGETVKVTDGPFSSFQGTIEAVDNERKKLTVSVKIFGRKTPMELSFTQVEKE